MTRVFLSYSRSDQAFVENVRQYLISWGYDTWMDIYNIKKGAYWPDVIDAGLQSCDIVIGVMSPEAVASRNVKNEWDWALINHKPLLLLMLQPCQVPMNYISINYIDFAKDYAKAVQQLQEALISANTGFYQPVRVEQISPRPPQQPQTANPLPFSPIPQQAGARPAQQPSVVVRRSGRGGNGLLVIGALVVLLVLGAAAGLLVVSTVLNNLNNSGSENNARPTHSSQQTSSGNGVSNAENFLSKLGRGDIDGARDYVCPQHRNILPETIVSAWISLGVDRVTGVRCDEAGTNIVSCSYEVTHTAGNMASGFDSLQMENNLVCDLIIE